MQAPRAIAREWTEEDDAFLEAILALRRIWDERHARVTLGDLGLDGRLVTFVVSGLCSRHGQFVAEWTGRASDAPPLEAPCPASERGRCGMIAPVFVLV
ncbi:MAG TPA: hypothetical protein VFM06_07325 [Candidatus Limnocylindria bacterium]|nr:hypothetical protein [Candidatus Limnocylindria bacterium]